MKCGGTFRDRQMGVSNVLLSLRVKTVMFEHETSMNKKHETCVNKKISKQTLFTHNIKSS